ncbi:MAG TPA: Tex-like N-terminal domain-containing protein [Acidobacteriota bacterium]|nr:Tex-like N-terminal domain-containing protein [Acidobacteriota bacterium]
MDAVIIGRIALETAIPESAVTATVSLLQNGVSGPFIVHYRKEATGGLDEAKVRVIQDRLAYYREVRDLREALFKSLTEQGKLTEALRAKIEGCFSKAELGDLTQQFRPRRKTRALEAIEKGLEPLAEYFWKQESDAWSVEEHIDVFVDPAKGVSGREQALQGIVEIIAEWIWENVEHRKALRDMLWSEGFLISSAVPAKVGQKTKYSMYYSRKEPVTSVPSHRILAIRRGCKEGILVSSIEGDNAKAIEYLLDANIRDRNSIFSPVIEAAVRESYHRMLRPMIETEVRTQLKERADRDAIKVFQENLANLLLSPPAGAIVTMGIDWTRGNGCSVAVVDGKGTFLEGTRLRFSPPPKPSHGKKARQPERNEENTEIAEIKPQAAGHVQDTPLPDATAESSVPEISFLPESTASDDGTAVGRGREENPDSAVIEEAVNPDNPEKFPHAAENGSSIIRDISPVIPIDVPASGAELSNAAESTAVASVEASASVEPQQNPGEVLRELLTRHSVKAIALGSGTGTKELDPVLRQIASEGAFSDLIIATANDAGLAIYSSSRLAREEFPNHNASMRCAISLARRLQDPLSELVKIDPKLIGVGQYQHDVDQKELHRGLQHTVQYCVNNVGVNPNKAGESLLRYVSGLNDKHARKIVTCRTAQGEFKSREALRTMTEIDGKLFTQAAGFLRIPDGENPLDRTAIHPDAYPTVEAMAAKAGVGIGELIGNRELIAALNLEDFRTETIGLPTLNDLREELLVPGRDPRKEFKVPKLRPGIRDISDLQPGVTMEGTVTNVTNFGAFVDIGVNQDGLVHLSQMANRFISDPRETVKVGEIVKVRVISIDKETKRIGLSMKAMSGDAPGRRKKNPRRGQKTAASSAGTAGNPGNASVNGKRPGINRPHNSGGRGRKRTVRNDDRTETVREKDPASSGPGPTLQEKIAILQSKFRGIK